MSGKAEISIWNGPLNFMVYDVDKIVKLNELEENIGKHKWDYDKKKEGWVADLAYFKAEDNSVATFVYTIFNRDPRSSREVGYDVYIPERFGLSFYLNKKIIIASTASDSALHYKVERKIFDTIAPLWVPIGSRYDPDFLFWLAYKHDTGNTKITNNLFIEDIRAVSSEIEKFNLSGAYGATTKVTSFTQAKSLLALNGQAKGARIVLRSSNEEYAFKLASDGRINAEKRDIEDGEEKVRYALEIHNLIQEAYTEYNKIKDTAEWKNERNAYRRKLVKECMDAFTDLSFKL